ncbi:MAG: hypothetical protein WC792_01070 [Candidatus Micrarchaeia archaeon]
METDPFGLLLGFLNVLLSVAVIFFAIRVHNDLNRTSLSKPLLIIAFAFFLLAVHESIDTISAVSPILGLGDEPEHSGASMVVETAFAVALFFGMLGFKSQFEKFEWVKEITQGQAQLVKNG